MIQIYFCKRNFDVQKAERYFKERRIQVQFVDMGKKGPSKKEVQLFIQKLGNPGAFDVDNELNAAWFLLRLSVHDPVMPLNAESDVPGGVKFVLGKLYEAVSQCDGIDLSPLKSALEA